METRCSLTLSFLLTVSFWSTIDADPQRNVSFEINPGCTRYECQHMGNSTFSNIVKVTARGSSDIIYYLLSNIGIPTVLLVQTKLDTTLTFDWDKLLSNDSAEFVNQSIIVEPPGNVMYSSALAFTRLIEYNDTDDAANVSYYAWNATAWNVYQFADFQWQNASELSEAVVLNATVLLGNFSNSSSKAQFYDDGSESELPEPQPFGYVSFVFTVTGDQSRASDLPRMMQSPNSTHLDLSIAVNSSFTLSRFGLETVLFNDQTKSETAVQEVISIDDEYTPGIFRTMSWKTVPNDDALQADSAFLQWRKVSYQSPQRSRAVATGIVSSEPQSIPLAGVLNSSIANAYFSSAKIQVPIAAFNISFGLAQDGTHAKANFTGWAVLYGIGLPYTDTMSVLVISIISAGLGIPVVIILFGTLWRLLYRKSKTSSYQKEN